MKQKYIVISESLVGSHKFSSIDSDVIQYELTFPITIKKVNDLYVIGNSISENETVRKVINEYKEHKKNGGLVNILVSFDLDEMGELMSELFLDTLEAKKVDPFDVFRVPLTENGYMAIKQFSNTSSYKEYLYHQQEIKARLQAEGLSPLSIQKIYSLKRLSQYKGRDLDISSNPAKVNAAGTSSATFVHNYINNINEHGV